MKTKTKLIWLMVITVALVIDYYIILPKLMFIMGWFILGCFAFIAPIIGGILLIRSMVTKPKDKGILGEKI